MIKSFIRKIFGDKNKRFLKKLNSTVAKVNALKPKIQSMTDDELKGKTEYFRELIKNGKTLNDILPEVYAVVREVSRRVTGKEHYDEQIYGGIVLHKGMISEMKTGEGKTLVSVLPVYLNALSGHVHVITANEYLAKRDSISMGKIHEFLGLSVGYIYNHMDKEARQAAYRKDITYGTASEFAFDYLRDNGEMSKQDMCQNGYNYAVIDEVDNILIDEAGTPCIISGFAEVELDGERVDLGVYLTMLQKIVGNLSKDHYEIDEKDRAIFLTDDGMSFVEDELKNQELIGKNESLYDFKNKNLQHYMYQLLKANYLFKVNVEYVVEKGKIIIVDESTGRKMYGRQYSDGLHQAIEAKEGVYVNPETQTLASVTLQNYFRMYKKLAGMTGTALTEATEFREIYGLDIVAIPTHRKMIRHDYNDEIYRTFKEKANAISSLVKECVKKQQPVLLGTVSVEKSEVISEVFTQNGIKHNVLNAKNHEKEADIIADAGMPGAVTIATNMAGRGTDIQLGGNPEIILERYIHEQLENGNEPSSDEIEKKKKEIYEEVKKRKEMVLNAGGLYVIGTERHESRRIDNQLRGRAGRQGDKGCSKFFLCLEDDLMRVFGSEKLDGMLQKLGLKEGEVITHPWINKSIEKAQEKVEARNYSIRKNLLKYDEVMNFERGTIYKFRNNIIDSCNFSTSIREIVDSGVMSILNHHISNETNMSELDVTNLQEEFDSIFGSNIVNFESLISLANNKEILKDKVSQEIVKKIEIFENSADSEQLNGMYKRLILRELDKLWRSHLLMTDHLRRSIHFRSYGQKDPLIEYKTESFELFNEMLDMLNLSIAKSVFCNWMAQNGMENGLQDGLQNGLQDGDGFGLSDFNLENLDGMDFSGLEGLENSERSGNSGDASFEEMNGEDFLKNMSKLLEQLKQSASENLDRTGGDVVVDDARAGAGKSGGDAAIEGRAANGSDGVLTSADSNDRSLSSADSLQGDERNAVGNELSAEDFSPEKFAEFMKGMFGDFSSESDMNDENDEGSDVENDAADIEMINDADTSENIHKVDTSNLGKNNLGNKHLGRDHLGQGANTISNATSNTSLNAKFVSDTKQKSMSSSANSKQSVSSKDSLKFSGKEEKNIKKNLEKDVENNIDSKKNDSKSKADELRSVNENLKNAVKISEGVEDLAKDLLKKNNNNKK